MVLSPGTGLDHLAIERKSLVLLGAGLRVPLSMTGDSLRASRRAFCVSRCSTLEGDIVPVWVGLS
jgi:hypothetical protein